VKFSERDRNKPRASPLSNFLVLLIASYIWLHHMLHEGAASEDEAGQRSAMVDFSAAGGQQKSEKREDKRHSKSVLGETIGVGGGPPASKTARVDSDEQVLSAFRAYVLQAHAHHAEMLSAYSHILHDNCTLRRFLYARNGKREPASELLIKHLQWRKEYGTDTIMDEDFSDLEEGGVMYWHGTDAEGRPNLVWRAGLHNPSDVTPERRSRFLVYLFETALKRYAPAQEVNVLFDCTGVGLKNADSGMINYASAMMADNYPERVATVNMFPTNFLVSSLWATWSIFLDRATKNKFRMLKTKDLQNKEIFKENV
jgi:hypothetical protein